MIKKSNFWSLGTLQKWSLRLVKVPGDIQDFLQQMQQGCGGQLSKNIKKSSINQWSSALVSPFLFPKSVLNSKHLCVASSSNIRRALAVQGSCNTVHVETGTWPIHTATVFSDLGLLLVEFATVTSWSRSSKISNLKLLVFSCRAFRNKLEKLLCFEARSASRW